MEVKSSKDISTKNLRLKAAVYGKSGTGKTVFGTTFPSPLFLDIDRGMLSTRGTNTRYIELPRTQDHLSGSTLYNQWWEAIKEAAKFAISDKESESIIVDSMTFVGEACLGAILGTRLKASFDDWALFFTRMRDFIFLIKEADKNCLFICHDYIERNELTGQVWILPMIQGQMKFKFADYFDEFYYSQVKESLKEGFEYQLIARSTSLYTAKSRLLKAGDKRDTLNPNFSELIKLLEK